MANILSLAVVPCNSPRPIEYNIIVDDPTSSIIVGNIYYFTTNGLTKAPSGCYLVRALKSTTETITGTVGTQYIDCEECSVANSNGLNFSDCDDLFGSIILDKDDFSPIPTIGDVYYLDVIVSSRFGPSQRVVSCFTFDGFVVTNTFNSELISGTTQTSCQDCKLNTPIIYVVSECLSGDLYYVPFPNNTYQDHLITFTDTGGITQYCGFVKEQVSGEPITGELISDLGNPKETGVNCEDCLTNVAEKRKLINCVDGHEDIVWASTLFTVGDATNISSGQGCYEISGDIVDPSTPVTYNELVDFDPHSDCEDCIECHGVTYDFSSCTTVEQIVETFKYTFVGEFNGYDIIVDDINGFAYISFPGNAKVVKFDLNTSSLVWSISVTNFGKMGLDVTNNILSIPINNFNFGTLFVDTTTGAQYTYPSMGASYIPRVSYFNPNDNLFYVAFYSSVGSSYVDVYSASSFNTISYINTFSCGSEPRDIIQVGSHIFVASVNGCLGVYDLSYNNITNLCIGSIYSLAYNPSLNLIYATGANSNLTVIDPNTFSFTYYNPSFVSCCCEKTVMYNTTNNKIYVSDPCPNHVYEIDENTYSILNTFTSSSGQPYGMAEWNGETYVVANNSLITFGSVTDFITSSINSYEYLPVGNTFFHPVYNVCCEITDVRSDMDGEYDFYSLISYDNCIDCQSVTHELFYTEECNSGAEGLMVAQSGQYSIGEIVKSHWGNSNFLCFEIIDNWDETNYRVPLFIFEPESQPSYTTCSECESGSTLGITIINCDTLVESQVNITLSEWITISGFPNLINRPTISDVDGNCYTVINTCPVDNIYPDFQLADFYLNVVQCRLSNPSRTEPPRSAGTEYFECVICCECGSTGSTITQVSPPHPVWTDGYGTPVTQLNMVSLGGMFGLNN